MPGSHVRFTELTFIRHAFIMVRVGMAAITAIWGGISCTKTPVLSPEEAVRRVGERIDKTIREWRAEADTFSLSFESEKPADSRHVVFWYFSHPLIAPAFATPEHVHRFNETHPDVRLEARPLGEWFYAMQKLTVSLAAGDLPDVALIKREWLGALVDSGKLAPVEMFLDAGDIADFPDHLRAAYSAHGMLYALPADGFCSVLYANGEKVGETLPQTWDELQTAARKIAQGTSDPALYPIAYLPFMELFWSAGGEAYFDRDVQCLNDPAAVETLRFLLNLREEKLMFPRSGLEEMAGLELFSRGKVALTVASSAYLLQLRGLKFPVRVGPVPGKMGPVSRFSENVVVIFAKYAEAKRESIGALLTYLTSSAVQTAEAAEKGSMPTRLSIQRSLTPLAGLEEAFRVARDAPLVRPWAIIEDYLRRLPAMTGV